MRRAVSLPSISFIHEIREEIELLRKEVAELREAIAVFEGEHARWILRYSWRLAFIANVSFAGLVLLRKIFKNLRSQYRISGFLGDLLVPGAFRVRGGLSNTLMEGAFSGVKPALPFVLAAVLLLRRQGFLRMGGAFVSAAYSLWLVSSGAYPWTNALGILCNILYLGVRSFYRVSLSDLRVRLRRVVPSS
jgi:hypothetical protein